jgi:hypothetical protein
MKHNSVTSWVLERLGGGMPQRDYVASMILDNFRMDFPGITGI